MAVAEMSRILSPDDVAKLTGLSEQTLANWRCRREGPRFIRLGRKIGYRAEDVEKWLDRNAVATGGAKN